MAKQTIDRPFTWQILEYGSPQKYSGKFETKEVAKEWYRKHGEGIEERLGKRLVLCKNNKMVNENTK